MAAERTVPASKEALESVSTILIDAGLVSYITDDNAFIEWSGGRTSSVLGAERVAVEMMESITGFRFQKVQAAGSKVRMFFYKRTNEPFDGHSS